jgi:hypothetical protein
VNRSEVHSPREIIHGLDSLEVFTKYLLGLDSLEVIDHGLDSHEVPA